MANVITVEDTIAKLREKNPNPRKIYNKEELTMLVRAMLADKDYVTKYTEVKGGKFITKERQLAEEFKAALVDVITQIGLNKKEAQQAVENYRVPKSLAAAIIDVVHAADPIYMKEIGKGIKFLSDGDVVQTIFYRVVDDKEHRIPQTNLGGKSSGYTKVKVKSHGRFAMKSRVNPDLKTLLK